MAITGLGCAAEYGAIIADRNGATIATLNTITDVEFSRVLNDASTARVTLVPDGDCCESLGDVRTWRHRLLLFRNGAFVWGGPILTADWTLGGFEVNAADIIAHLGTRLPHNSLSFTSADTTAIAEALIEDGFLPDDPGHEVTILDRSGVALTRSYTVDTGYIDDHLQDLADGGGLDFTAVGDTILLMPDSWDANVGLVTDADMPAGLTVSEDGTALATRWVVFGPEGTTIKGEAGGVDDYYGLIERFVRDTSLTDQASAQAAAEARLNASQRASVYIDTQEVTLSSEAGVDVTRIVPGWCIDLATTTTCRNISQRMKITGLTVEADGDGEAIKVQLGPVSLESALSGATTGTGGS